MHALLDLVHHEVQVDEVEVEVEGEGLQPLADDADVQRLQLALPRHHMHASLHCCAHIIRSPLPLQINRITPANSLLPSPPTPPRQTPSEPHPNAPPPFKIKFGPPSPTPALRVFIPFPPNRPNRFQISHHPSRFPTLPTLYTVIHGLHAFSEADSFGKARLKKREWMER
jgi:hypothetical protein